MQTLKLNSFRALSVLIHAEKHNPDNWNAFLKEKGHTQETFKYMPEHLQTALKFSFAKRQDKK